MAPDDPPGTTGVALDLTPLAQSAARFFLSLELAHDAGSLTRLGSGRLRLDFRQRLARHGERWVTFPHMGGTLRQRLTVALEAAQLSFDRMEQAELEADVKLAVVTRPALPTPASGWAGDDGPLVRYEAAVTVRFGVGGSRWQAQHKGAATWPETWGMRP